METKTKVHREQKIFSTETDKPKKLISRNLKIVSRISFLQNFCW